MDEPLRRFIVWLLVLFALLLTGAAVLATTQVRNRAYEASSVSRAEVVSMQPAAGEPPEIRVIGPSGSQVQVDGTRDLQPPYPAEGDYIDVVFLRSGDAVIPATGRGEHAGSGGLMIAGIWLGWGAVIAVGLVGGRYILDTARPWWPRK